MTRLSRDKRTMVRGTMLGALLLLVGFTSAPAWGAAPYRVSSLRTISGPSDMPAACLYAPGAEGESFLAASPVDRKHLVATWGAGHGDASITAVTRDGGRTWSRSLIPGMTSCTGGSKDITFDGWAAIDGGGGAYFAGFSRMDLTTGGPFDIDVLAAGSQGGGEAWQPASVVDTGLQGANGILSRTSVAADPMRSGRAWAMWSRLITNPALEGVYVSRTDDGGAGWGPPIRVARPAVPGTALAAWQMVVLPDGTLVASMHEVETHEQSLRGGFGLFPESVPAVAKATRSTDGGRTWSRLSTIARLPSYVLARMAVGREGALWLVWGESDGEQARLQLAKSEDGGRTWGAPIEAASFPANGVKPLQLQASVAVARSGAIGASWYDMADGAGQLRHRFAASTDGGRVWKTLPLGDAFDPETGRGNGEEGGGNGDGPVGAYQGLAPLGRHSFGALFIAGTGDGPANPTDVRFARIVRGS